MNEKEFEELVKRAQKGDAHAFGAAYGVFAADAYRFALFYMKNTQDAEDAVQEACLKAWRRLPSLKKTESFRSWFFKILSNICKSSLSALKPVAALDEIPETASADGSTELKTEMAELISRLPSEDRRIVLLSAVAGFTSREIAEMTGSNANTVRSRLSRTLRSLRKELSTEVTNNETT